MNSQTLFSKTPPVKLFFLASIPGAVGMLASRPLSAASMEYLWDRF